MTKENIVQNMEVIGADGVHVGTVDGVANGRIRLTKRDSGEGRMSAEDAADKGQKALCMKQATAAHANAEVDIEKAKMASQGPSGGSTSSMGAGKSSP